MRKGFTLIELMIVVVIVGILAVTLFTSLKGCGRGSEADATEAMKGHVEKMGWIWVGGACAGTDEDNDGYISCSARVKETKEGPTLEKDLSCASGAVFSTSEGCKTRMPSMFGGSRNTN